ncbi:MAG: hypothetical protein JJU28_25185 [Cyclobacteriaceae bacterium]|nr:hypothetical protein [Cyclobacteriaceae bacterium]
MSHSLRIRIIILFFMVCSQDILAQISCKPLQDAQGILKVRFNQYDHDRHNLLIHTLDVDLQEPASKVQFLESVWRVQTTIREVGDDHRGFDVSVNFICEKGEVSSASLSLEVEFDNWSADNFVLLPAAAYNGNRFPYRRIDYSPKLLDPRDIGPEIGTIVTDIPKLNHSKGPSRIQERTGGMSVPSAGFYAPNHGKVFWMFTRQGTHLGDSGIDIEENRERDKAYIRITAPVVRELYKYRIADNRWPSDDMPANFKTGDSLTLSMRLYGAEAENLQVLYDMFFDLRKTLFQEHALRSALPLSAAFELQERKFNRENFVESHGYYSVGMRENFLQDWQIGWTGGMISTYPLLFSGNLRTRENVLRNFDWLFPDGIAPSGYFWDSGEKGTIWHGGDIRKPHTKNWHLIRKSGDGLYYVIKQFMLMETMGLSIPRMWIDRTKGVADAFVNTWSNGSQLGHFVDNITGEVIVGGSSSGAIVPAALALAAGYYEQPAYLQIAKEMALHYYENFTSQGYTTGGPGDAMQNPDSESSYALVESFTVLFEVTGDAQWLKMAEKAASQFATWVIAYNYEFPPQSLFGKEKMRSLGAVFANTQNKHGAPGICTHSGLGLLKLYRATGDQRYAMLLQDIARSLPQYINHPAKPIAGTNTGWVCERVSTTDWLEGIGEISYLSTWAETSLMLTWIEIPGIYVDLEYERVFTFDNVDIEILQSSQKRFAIKVSNPNQVTADVRLMIESAEQKNTTMGHNSLFSTEFVSLKPGESKTLRFNK